MSSTTPALTVTPRIAKLITDFSMQLVRAANDEFAEHVLRQFAVKGGSARGLVLSGAAMAMRRRAPKQLCPVPGCKNAAAPVFGMVCAKHKDVPKAKIKTYREARRKRVAAASKKTGHA
jgi:hypothetical protein